MKEQNGTIRDNLKNINNNLTKEEIRAYNFLDELKNGNKRFVKGVSGTKRISEAGVKELLDKLKDVQKPKAILLCCSDSRVPPEIVFDQELGELFVIRNAGHLVDDFVLGSIEFGIEYVNVPLIFVLAHNECGAIKATIEGKKTTENLDKIINHIKEKIDISEIDKTNTKKALTELEERNLLNSIKDLKKSNTISQYLREKKLIITGGKYSLETGKVRFLD